MTSWNSPCFSLCTSIQGLFNPLALGRSLPQGMVWVQRHNEEWLSIDKFWGQSLPKPAVSLLVQQLGVRSSTSTDNFSWDVLVLLPRCISFIKACFGVLLSIQRKSCAFQIISSLLAADRSEASPDHSNYPYLQFQHDSMLCNYHKVQEAGRKTCCGKKCLLKYAE